MNTNNLVNIANLDKAEVLVALYNAANVNGMGLFAHKPCFFGKEDAAQVLSKSTRVDYLHGRVLKIELGGNELDTFHYNRDNGINLAEKALRPLIEQQAALAEIAELQAALAEKQAYLAELQAALAEKQAALAEQQAALTMK